MHEEFGREAVAHTHGVDLVHLGGDTWVTSGTDYCPCSHLEQVEAVSADVGEAGEGCGVVKASAEIINCICIKTWNYTYLQERSMDCNLASVSTDGEVASAAPWSVL